MSEEQKQGFWASMSDVEREQIKFLLRMLGFIVLFTIIASLIVGALLALFG